MPDGQHLNGSLVGTVLLHGPDDLNVGVGGNDPKSGENVRPSIEMAGHLVKIVKPNPLSSIEIGGFFDILTLG